MYYYSFEEESSLKQQPEKEKPLLFFTSAEEPIRTTSGLLLTHRKPFIMNFSASTNTQTHYHPHGYYRQQPMGGGEEEEEKTRYSSEKGSTSVCSLAETYGNRVVFNGKRLLWMALATLGIVAMGVQAVIKSRRRRSRQYQYSTAVYSKNLQTAATPVSLIQQAPLSHTSNYYYNRNGRRGGEKEDIAPLVPILFFQNLTNATNSKITSLLPPIQKSFFQTKADTSTSSSKQIQTYPKSVSTTTTTTTTTTGSNKNVHAHFLPQNHIFHTSNTKRTNTNHKNNQKQQGYHPSLAHLVDSFHQWMHQHQRNYKSQKEKDHRFHVWAQNQLHIDEKNRRHGPCKLTGQAIFGSNHFQDLTDEEFYQKHLTGYTAAVLPSSQNGNTNNYGNKIHDDVAMKPNPYTNVQYLRSTTTMHNDINKQQPREQLLPLRDPIHGVTRHPTIQEKFVHQWNKEQRRRTTSASTGDVTEVFDSPKAQVSWCSWDVCGTNPSCWYNCAMDYLYGNGGGTMIPSSSSANVESVDWRKIGVVTSVHSQGNCGACWAITATETIESCYAIQTGVLLDLDESEIIVCDSSCQMCNGGWPQNAYEYAMKQKGLRQEGSRSESSYNGDFLISLTMSSYGESDTFSANDLENFKSSICTSDSSAARYGAIKNWGYSTDRCICYSNGSGCDCDNQNEAKAIQNIATYGPAAICLDASTWKEYKGGIMTPDSGCSQKFLSMNHCVQVVGYIFTDSLSDSSSSGGGTDDLNNKEGNKNERDKKEDEKNDKQQQKREGYFIVRNQWGQNWGMNGYAYLSLGSNTCGILNDMTHAYME